MLGAVSEVPNKSIVKTRNVVDDDDEDAHYLSDTGNIRHEKKILRGFQTGLTQSLRRWLEA